MKTTHGLKRTTEYIIWSSMKRRCNDPGCEQYKDYGLRGIAVCPRWDSFENFLADMGKRPSKDHTLERMDNESGYAPSNCIWATREEQGNNKRNNRKITAFGKTLTARQWCKEVGIDYWRLIWRINNGWSAERALTQPSRQA